MPDLHFWVYDLWRKVFFDAYQHRAYPWDFAVGAAIIQEAGGVVTQTDGGEINWLDEKTSTLASNGKIYEEIVDLRFSANSNSSIETVNICSGRSV